MFKLCFFLWRRPDFSHGQFVDYYEHRHAPLGAGLGPPMSDYRRNYPTWERAPSDALSFDVMTEIWHERREDFTQQLAVMTQSPAKETISADEVRFMNRDRQLFLALDEHGVAGPYAAEGAGSKMLRFVKAAGGLSADGFRDRYEAEIVPALDCSRENVAGYRRSYVVLGDDYSFSGGAQNIMQIDPGATVFDMIEEIWFADAPDNAVVANLHERGVNAGLVDGGATASCRVEEYRSPGGRPAAPVLRDVIAAGA